MKFLLQLSLLAIFNISFAQNNNTIEIQKDSLTDNKIQKVEKTSSGGLDKFYKYISDNFRSPNVYNFPGGKEIVEFTIKTDGTVGNIKILKDIGYGVGEQIKKILQKSPKWTPAVKDGQPVECTYTLPINIPRGIDE
ncbi:energy transducer TonB [Flavobacterium sp. RSB2_4_14]|uniref:energy transducer TonB n=1 Tax=Flavobacterium sp. RSB2_4_14 TaxID=3447665 RepID=UPI003F37D91D